MSIRLNKVTKEFNIGLQTAVEFLQKKGFDEVQANPNYKITEEQYSLLQNEFSSDKGLRHEATQLIQQHIGHTKERKDTGKAKPVEEVQIEAPKVSGPKILGRIDLGDGRADASKAEKPEKAKAEKPKAEKAKAEAAPAEMPKAKVANEKKEPKVVPAADVKEAKPKKAEDVKPEVKKAAPAPEEKVVAAAKVQKEAPVAMPKEAEKPVVQKEEVVAPAAEKKAEDEVFRLTPAANAAPSLTIKGKIDLSSLNQTTRPKKKSAEERRRERAGQDGQGGDRKKRVRIGKERVDVNAVANQPHGQQKKNNGGQQQQQNQGGNGKNKKQKNHPKQAPVQPEVSDEEVAKQVAAMKN